MIWCAAIDAEKPLTATATPPASTAASSRTLSSSVAN
jgi:hypothetical protein